MSYLKPVHSRKLLKKKIEIQKNGTLNFLSVENQRYTELKVASIDKSRQFTKGILVLLFNSVNGKF